MKDKSIFTRQNQTLVNLFRDAKHPDKMLCVPIDYAKQTPMPITKTHCAIHFFSGTYLQCRAHNTIRT